MLQMMSSIGMILAISLLLIFGGCSGGGGETPQAVAPSTSTAPPPATSTPPAQGKPPVFTPAPTVVAKPTMFKGKAVVDLSNLKVEGIPATFVPNVQQQGVSLFDGATTAQEAFIERGWHERTVGGGEFVSSVNPSMFLVGVEFSTGHALNSQADAWVERAGWVQAGDQGGVVTISVPYSLSVGEFLEDEDFHTHTSVQMIVMDQTVLDELRVAGTQEGVLTVTKALQANEQAEFNLRTQVSAFVAKPGVIPGPEQEG